MVVVLLPVVQVLLPDQVVQAVVMAQAVQVVKVDLALLPVVQVLLPDQVVQAVVMAQAVQVVKVEVVHLQAVQMVRVVVAV